VAFDDDRALAGALERLFADSVLRERLAAAARRRVVERHSLDRVAREYVAIFEELLAKASRPAARVPRG
ncbi:MAG TPA: glycosyltransferase, partial [Pirellulales bacterium]|nr:glycosyltransferase [Pirellulales bacterium]